MLSEADVSRLTQLAREVRPRPERQGSSTDSGAPTAWRRGDRLLTHDARLPVPQRSHWHLCRYAGQELAGTHGHHWKHACFHSCGFPSLPPCPRRFCGRC